MSLFWSSWPDWLLYMFLSWRRKSISIHIFKLQMDSRQLIPVLAIWVDAFTAWVGWMFMTQRVFVVWLKTIKTKLLCFNPCEENYMHCQELQGAERSLGNSFSIHYLTGTWHSEDLTKSFLYLNISLWSKTVQMWDATLLLWVLSNFVSFRLC